MAPHILTDDNTLSQLTVITHPSPTKCHSAVTYLHSGSGYCVTACGCRDHNSGTSATDACKEPDRSELSAIPPAMGMSRPPPGGGGGGKAAPGGGGEGKGPPGGVGVGKTPLGGGAGGGGGGKAPRLGGALPRAPLLSSSCDSSE